jgi:hypothetical protein
VVQVDGGSGHSGKRSPEVLLGLGGAPAPLRVDLSWRDDRGVTHQQDLWLKPGRHTVELCDTAQKVAP